MTLKYEIEPISDHFYSKAKRTIEEIKKEMEKYIYDNRTNTRDPKLSGYHSIRYKRSMDGRIDRGRDLCGLQDLSVGEKADNRQKDEERKAK